MQVFETYYPPNVQSFSCFVGEASDSAETAYHLFLVSLEAMRSEQFNDLNPVLKAAITGTMAIACGALETCLEQIEEDKNKAINKRAANSK
ncbi:MAG: hypothetical protein WCR52_11505 [Bacteroidota bacterium]|uniref:hypothetical protein n=1 Tax=Runella sp. TaxID=1960881 RepID=UPI00301A47FD